MRHRQKIAIARLISDLIKSDTVICPEEIAAYNKIVRNFDISDAELYEAQYISLADAMAIVKNMSPDDQQRFLKTFYNAAHSEKRCVPKEALLMLAISNLVNDKEDKYAFFSSEINRYQMPEKYVIYLESDYMPVINDEILLHYDTISNLLKLWNFEFIYIPKLSQSFRDMDTQFLYDLLRYMNPRLPVENIEMLYNRLTTFTTESYTRDYMTHTYQQQSFYDIPPSILIFIGNSILPSKTQSHKDLCMLNMLTIRLEDETNSVLNEVRRFIQQYEKHITEPEICCPKVGMGLFRYHGLYKELFDYLARHKSNGVENSIIIDLTKHRITMRGEEVPMSGTQLATYMLILHQTFCTHHGGLIKAGQHRPLSETEVQRLTRTFNTMCNIFRDTPIDKAHNYLDEVNNIRSYIARIRTVITNVIDSDDLNYYLPKDSLHKDMYQITIDPSHIHIKDAISEYEFTKYPLWKKI